MHFNVPFHFFKVPFDFVCLPKAAFCKDKGHRGTPKGRKMLRLFFSNRMAGIFSFIFTCYFIFPKSILILPPFQNQHFAMLRHIGVPPKEKKCHHFFFLRKRHFFVHFYPPFQFFKVPFHPSAVPKPLF